MKYKTMYGLHEVRMWVTTIGSGILAAAALVATNPELKEAAGRKWSNIKDKFKKKPTKRLKIVVVDENGNPLK